MAVLSLPLTFQNSFWSQDYRTGLEVLYTQLEKVRSSFVLQNRAHSSYAHSGGARE